MRFQCVPSQSSDMITFFTGTSRQTFLALNLSVWGEKQRRVWVKYQWAFRSRKKPCSVYKISGLSISLYIYYILYIYILYIYNTITLYIIYYRYNILYIYIYVRIYIYSTTIYPYDSHMCWAWAGWACKTAWPCFRTLAVLDNRNLSNLEIDGNSTII